jgi:hypothetical protein
MEHGLSEGNGGFALVNSATRIVTGQWVAHVQKSLHERAFEAADLFNGTSLFVRPTIIQSAGLWRVNRSYVGWALKRQKERELILAGTLPLVPPTVQALPASASTEQRLADIVAERGVNATLAMLVAIERQTATV